jgi:hypothetical protein
MTKLVGRRAKLLDHGQHMDSKVEKMAFEVEKVDATVAVSQFYQSNSSINKVVKGENNTVISKASSAPVELEELQYDLSELIHILHVTERSSVKEIILADIQLLLSKTESIEDLNKNQLETSRGQEWQH